jgi:hypothetical protein
MTPIVVKAGMFASGILNANRFHVSNRMLICQMLLLPNLLNSLIRYFLGKSASDDLLLKRWVLPNLYSLYSKEFVMAVDSISSSASASSAASSAAAQSQQRSQQTQQSAQDQQTQKASNDQARTEREAAQRARVEAEQNQPSVNTSGQTVGSRVNTTA